MLINASDSAEAVGPRDFEVTLDDCRYQCVVNVTMGSDFSPEDSTAGEPRGTTSIFFKRDPSLPAVESAFTTIDPGALSSYLSAMDYRFRPEIWEQEQRKRRLDSTDRTEGDA